jgi:23S rRNA pseudouridine1911/1915/1917 synthase
MPRHSPRPEAPIQAQLLDDITMEPVVHDLPEIEDLEGLDDAETPVEGAWVAPEVQHLNLSVGADGHGKRLDQWLAVHASSFSRNHLKGLIEDGAVVVEGQVITSPSRKLHAGQKVQAELRPTAQASSFTPEAMDLNIVFEDAHFMVIHKPVGMVVHPAAGNWSGTLLNGLLAHHEGARHLPRAGIVHRLDKDTSGLMVVGKTVEACTALSRAIAAHDVRRQYRALVWGVPPEMSRIELPIGRDPVSRVKMAVVKGGKPAMTDVQTLASLPVEQKIRTVGGVVQGDVSAVECTLHTGRTHQIRVHLAAKQHPLLADALYGGKPELGMQRQALHAFRLSLAHPQSGESLTFEAEMPPDMACAWGQVMHNGSIGT